MEQGLLSIEPTFKQIDICHRSGISFDNVVIFVFLLIDLEDYSFVFDIPFLDDKSKPQQWL